MSEEKPGRHYRAKKGARIKTEVAQIVVSEMSRLDPEGIGVSCRRLQISQQPEEAPLHPQFEWNDRLAGVLYRDEQARHLMAAVEIELEVAEGESQWGRAYLPVTKGGDEEEDEEAAGLKIYRPTEVVFAEPDEAEEQMRYAEGVLRAWRSRVRWQKAISERFASVLAAIDQVLPE